MSLTVEDRQERDRIDAERSERGKTLARERAARGASLFDRLFPDWSDRVKLTTLKMASGDDTAANSCVLVQVSQRNYPAGRVLLARLMQRKRKSISRRQETYYGLNVSPSVEDAVEFSDLTAAWKGEIRTRRG